MLFLNLVCSDSKAFISLCEFGDGSNLFNIASQFAAQNFRDWNQ